MEQSDRYLASLTDEGRYRLLVEAVTDYAIYLLVQSPTSDFVVRIGTMPDMGRSRRIFQTWKR